VGQGGEWGGDREAREEGKGGSIGIDGGGETEGCVEVREGGRGGREGGEGEREGEGRRERERKGGDNEGGRGVWGVCVVDYEQVSVHLLSLTWPSIPKRMLSLLMSR